MIVGDIHGRYGALMQALERAGYSDGDILYSVGDFCDRGMENIKVLEFLSRLDNFRPVLGNHDAWLQDYLYLGCEDYNWMYNNGGVKTVEELEKTGEEERRRFSSFMEGIPFCRIEEDSIVIHGGLMEWDTLSVLGGIARARDRNIESSFRLVPSELWDRDYLSSALSVEERGGVDNTYSEVLESMGERVVFIGHSIIGDKPFFSSFFHLAAIDTGAASMDGRITVMDMESLDFWQSDMICTFYGGN